MFISVSTGLCFIYDAWMILLSMRSVKKSNSSILVVFTIVTYSLDVKRFIGVHACPSINGIRQQYHYTGLSMDCPEIGQIEKCLTAL